MAKTRLAFASALVLSSEISLQSPKFIHFASYLYAFVNVSQTIVPASVFAFFQPLLLIVTTYHYIKREYIVSNSSTFDNMPAVHDYLNSVMYLCLLCSGRKKHERVCLQGIRDA